MRGECAALESKFVWLWIFVVFFGTGAAGSRKLELLV
jgi:hypothetical protein